MPVHSPPESLSQAPDSQLHRIVELAGAQRRSDRLLNRLDQAFKDAGIITYPNLVDPGLEPDDRVFMIDARHPIEGLAPTSELFRNEAALQNFIWANRYQLNDFQNLGLRNFRQQATLDSGRRVDLPCERRGLKQLVGIELKVRQPRRPGSRSAPAVPRRPGRTRQEPRLRLRAPHSDRRSARQIRTQPG
jgi:hypothetical protein